MSSGGIEQAKNKVNKEEKQQQKEYEVGVQSGVNSYPAKFFNRTETNDKLELLQSASALAKNTGLEQPSFDRDLLNVIKQQRKDADYVKFDTWIQENFDITDPVTLRLLNEINPDFLHIRQSEIERQYDMAKRYELINLRGPRNQDDLILLWQVNSGMVQRPKLAMTLENDAGKVQTEIKRGFLNTRRYAVFQTAKDDYKKNHLGREKLGSRAMRTNGAAPGNKSLQGGLTDILPMIRRGDVKYEGGANGVGANDAGAAVPF